MISPSLSHFLRTLTTLIPDTHPNTTDIINKILEHEIITTRYDGVRRYLICWKEKILAENTWLNQADLQRIDLDVLEQYESAFTTNSTGSSSLPPEENDADI